MISLLLIYFTVAILVSFLCSLWEAVLLSISPSYAEIKLQEGSPLGKSLESFKSNIDQPLAAILTLNTIAHTIGAIGVGQQAALIWENAHPIMTSFVVPVVMTLGILILSELIPKTLGATHWQRLAPFAVSSIRLIIKLLFPLVWLSQFITRSLKSDESESVFTKSDFMAMADIGAKEGVFEEEESELIKNFLRFRTINVRDIMTPRTVVKATNEEMSIRTFFDNNKELPFSRIPVYSGDRKDNVTGYILKDELLAHLIENDGDKELTCLRRKIIVIHEKFPIPDLFNRFLESREHIALVVDEFGGMAGIVTMEDVIETLLGTEIIDEMDNTEDMQALARKNWERRARRLGLIQEVPDNKS